MKRENDPNVTLKIPRPLYERLKQVIEGSGFHSVTEFAVYVLRDLVSHHAAQRNAPKTTVASTPGGADASSTPAPEAEALTPAEIEAIRSRLESLGYL